ncbi:MAG: fructosamine kinase family protein [Cyanobacteria bacterium K_Offshore_0m_m2_072]|nr:fructosamine kinase family protein [Cyanobacteria bacterium K_Offshore_0m_m2_072]
MNDALQAWLRQQLGAALRSHSPVGGGCIHSAWMLQLADGRRVFVKCNRAAALPLLEAEADGLAALAAVAPAELLLPTPLACARVGDQAVLVLSWLDLKPRGDDRDWSRLGQSLARLHRRSLAQGAGQGRFGWQRDNFIGSTPQINAWHDDWGAFFVERRLRHQLRQAPASARRLAGTERLLLRVSSLLAAHQPEPVLVHGDLWSGNAALLPGDTAAIYDPAVYRGDREVDLAMARLFGGFPAAFFSGYEQEWPLPPGARERVDVYNLYHLLNHANLFGGGYWQQVEACIQLLINREVPG